MACKMLFFDYRESEQKFFEENCFENYEIKFFKESLNESTLSLLSEDDFEKTMIISVFITSTVSSEIISKFKNLRVISTRSTGYDHICINSCRNKNIALINVDSYGSTAVSQFTMGLIIMLVRNLKKILDSKQDESIMYQNFCGRDLNNLTLGIIGTGSIGAGVCKIAHCAGMNILAYDIRPKTELVSDCDVQYVDMDALLANADIVSLHLPYMLENYHMFSSEQFEKMKDGSYFINVSRGELVDTDALLEYMKRGKFKGVGLDVVACSGVESANEDNREKSSVSCMQISNSVRELAKFPNVIITPHIAYDTQEAVDYILNETFKSISDFITGGHENRVI